MVKLHGEHVQTEETVTRTVNYVTVKAQIDTDDIVVIPGVATISAAICIDTSDGSTLTTSVSNNEVTITEAAQVDVNVLIHAWE